MKDIHDEECRRLSVGFVALAGFSMDPPCAGQRLRIWQINAQMRCSVLGTCLSLDDLHVIARRARRPVDARVSAYQLHSWFVDMVASPNDVSKLVDKALEKRHLRAAQEVRRARTEEDLEARWKEVSARGQLAGAYWGAMSHPLCSIALQWRLFGEIHMLSHLVGAARRSDSSRVHELEVTCAALDGRVAQLKHDHRAILKDRKRLEDELALRQHDLERAERRLVIAQRRIAVLESETLAGELDERIRELERQLREAQERVRAADATLADTRGLLDDARAAGGRAGAQLLELATENEALESELAARITCPMVERQDLKMDDDGSGLRGKRILYVGGRTGLVPHYRALVERRGGEFLYHDGGLEDSLDAVTRALGTVDVVVCPLDCVSHAASMKVKRACKHLAKPFVPLRTSGLSSFARGIGAIARSETSPAPYHGVSMGQVT